MLVLVGTPRSAHTGMVSLNGSFGQTYAGLYEQGVVFFPFFKKVLFLKLVPTAQNYQSIIKDTCLPDETV